MKCFSRKFVLYLFLLILIKLLIFYFETWSCESLLMRSLEMTREDLPYKVLNPACWVKFYFLLSSADNFQN